ncbi:MAG: hypothetical protein ACFFED_04045 [Candidatus Thorarchaeota archaeon]
MSDDAVKPDAPSEEAHQAALRAIYEDDEPEIVEEISYPDFAFSIDGMDPRNLAILFSKSELRVLDKELDRIIAEISSTRQALDLTHADKDLLIVRAKDLRREFDETKMRRTRLRSVEGNIPLKNVLAHLTTQESKLQKLESAEKTLDPVIFEEEKKRLQVRIKNLKNDLKSTLKVSKQWAKSMDSEIKHLRREQSRLDAKLKIGDISQTAYDSKMKDITNSIVIIEGGKKTLEEIIQLAEKTK